MDQKTLLNLIGKNYSGDAGLHEKFLIEKLQKEAKKQVAQDTKKEQKSPSKKEEKEQLSAKNRDVSVSEEEDDDPNRKLTKEEAEVIRKMEEQYRDSLATIKDAIAPSMMKIDATKLQIGDTFVRTFFAYAYPDYLEGNWLSPIINWDVKFDMSLFVYPVESAHVMKFLRRRLTELQSERSINMDKGLVSDPALDAQLQDVEELRASLTR